MTKQMLATAAQEDEKAITVTKRGFMSRIEPEEQAAIMEAAATSPALNLWLYKLSLADRVHLDHPDLTPGLDALVTAGVLTEARKNAILAP